MQGFNEMRARFAGLYSSVKALHTASTSSHRGHGFDHDVTVAQMALLIAQDEHIGEMAWCAGMMHSIDRLAPTQLLKRTTRLCAQSLATLFTEDEREIIVEAAIRHGELNKSDQSVVQQTLMDADRLVNLQPSVIIRAGQFRPNIPAFEFEYLQEMNPATTYHNPPNVVDAIRINISEYLRQMRIPKAIEMAEDYRDKLESFIGLVRADNDLLGLTGITL